MDVATQDVSEIGQNLKGPYIETTYPKNQFKWLRGARGADGAIYGVPSNANKVLRIMPETGVCDTIGGAGEILVWRRVDVAAEACVRMVTYAPCDRSMARALEVARWSQGARR